MRGPQSSAPEKIVLSKVSIFATAFDGAWWKNSTMLGFFTLGMAVALLFVISFFAIANRFVKVREDRLKESLKAMGCSSGAYYGHWLVYSGAFSFFYAASFLLMCLQDNRCHLQLRYRTPCK